MWALSTELLPVLGSPGRAVHALNTEPSLRRLLEDSGLELSLLQLPGCSLRALVLSLGREAFHALLTVLVICFPSTLARSQHKVPLLPITSESSTWLFCRVCPCAGSLPRPFWFLSWLPACFPMASSVGLFCLHSSWY